MVKNPIDEAKVANDSTPLKIGDIVTYRQPKKKVDDGQEIHGKIFRVTELNQDEVGIKSIFFGQNYYVKKAFRSRVKKIDWKRVRADKEVMKGDIIVTKDGLETEVIDVIDEGIIVYMRGERGINTLFYKNDFFWMAFMKGEWRFEKESIYDFDLEWIVKYLPDHSYLEGHEDEIMIKAKDFKMGDMVMYREEGGMVRKVNFEGEDKRVLTDIRDESLLDKGVTNNMKGRVVFVHKQNDNDWFFKTRNSCEDFPKMFTKDEVKLALGLK